VRHAVNGVDLKEVVAPGIVERPAGIALYDGTRLVNAIDADALLVTDNATGRLHLFSKAGASLADIETGLPEGALGGVVQGPDGLVYLVDLLEGRVFRFE
jgi:hypothetical protein